MKHLFISLVLIAGLAKPVLAETVLGTWLSPPDHKGQVGHLVVARCGDTICGTLVRAFDKTGRAIVTPNVGKQLVWGMRPGGNDVYRGEVYVPLMKANFAAEMTVSGRSLTVRGCSGVGLCKAQIWTRVN